MPENEAKSMENAQAPSVAVKKNRRGVSNATKATSQLKFHEKDAASNGLFIGQLKEVTVDYRTIGADSKGLTSFAGSSIARLVFHFTSCHANENEQRHVYQTLLPVESNIDTIPGGRSEWQVNNVFNWIKHILDVYYLKGRQLTPKEEDALTLPFEDFDEEGNYVAIDAADVINGYKTVFENAAAMLNGSFGVEGDAVSKPKYKTEDGKYIKVWIKLLRAKRVKNEWRNISSNGDLGFDPFIGEGVIELQKTNMPPAVLKVDFARESITPKQINKQPNIGLPNMAGAPVMGGTIASPNMPNAGVNSAFTDAGLEEMPF